MSDRQQAAKLLKLGSAALNEVLRQNAELREALDRYERADTASRIVDALEERGQLDPGQKKQKLAALVQSTTDLSLLEEQVKQEIPQQNWGSVSDAIPSSKELRGDAAYFQLLLNH